MTDRRIIIRLYNDISMSLLNKNRNEGLKRRIFRMRERDIYYYYRCTKRKILSIVLFSFISWLKGSLRSQAFHSCNSWYSFNFIEATCRIFSSCSARRRRQKNSWARIRSSSKGAYWLEHLFKINSNFHPIENLIFLQYIVKEKGNNKNSNMQKFIYPKHFRNWISFPQKAK